MAADHLCVPIDSIVRGRLHTLRTGLKRKQSSFFMRGRLYLLPLAATLTEDDACWGASTLLKARLEAVKASAREE